MADKRCTVCGKPLTNGGPICQSCQEKIKGEAIGQRKQIHSDAEKEFRKHGVVKKDQGD